jgi:hypothetical protein
LALLLLRLVCGLIILTVIEVNAIDQRRGVAEEMPKECQP